jgi:hypothetical protein
MTLKSAASAALLPMCQHARRYIRAHAALHWIRLVYAKVLSAAKFDILHTLSLHYSRAPAQCRNTVCAGESCLDLSDDGRQEASQMESLRHSHRAACGSG